MQPQDLVTAVEQTGYGASVLGGDTPGAGAGAHEGHDLLADRALRQRALVSLALTVPVLLIAMVPPIGDALGGAAPWLELVLTTPVVAWAAWPFHRAAALNARHGASTMDTLVSLGRHRRLRLVPRDDPRRRLRRTSTTRSRRSSRRSCSPAATPSPGPARQVAPR